MPQNMEELKAAIAAGADQQIWAAFPDQQIVDTKKLVDFFPGYQLFTAQFVAMQQELETVKKQLEGVLPRLERASLTLEQRTADSSAGLETSIAALEKRDREISEKLNSSFHSIDTQIEGVSLQASTAKSMQDGIHNVVAKQQKDMEGMKLDIEIYVVNAMG